MFTGDAAPPLATTVIVVCCVMVSGTDQWPVPSMPELPSGVPLLMTDTDRASGTAVPESVKVEAGRGTTPFTGVGVVTIGTTVVGPAGVVYAAEPLPPLARQALVAVATYVVDHRPFADATAVLGGRPLIITVTVACGSARPCNVTVVA